MDRALAQDGNGNALTAFLPAARAPGVPDDAPMPAALVVIWCGRHLLLVFDRFRLTTPPREEYAAVYTAHVATRHHDFTPDAEIGAIRWWDTTGPPPGGTQILDATLARHTRLERHTDDGDATRPPDPGWPYPPLP